MDSDENTFSVEDLLGIVPNVHRLLGDEFLKESPIKIRPESRDKSVFKGRCLQNELADSDIRKKPDSPKVANASKRDVHQIENIENEVYQTNRKRARKRNRRAEKSRWDRQIQKSNRLKGEEYTGINRQKSEETGTVKSTKVVRAAKELGPRCRSNYCSKRENFKCDEFLESDRKKIFMKFWKFMDWDGKHLHVTSLVDCVPVKRRINGSKKRRNDTLIYYLKLNERKVQVCRKMFLSTLGLKKDQVLNWIKQKTDDSPKSPSIQNEKSPKQVKKSTFAHQFLDDLPKLPSHYCRSTSSKLYLEPGINSKNELFDLYKQYCEEKEYPPCSRFVISRLLEEKIISLFSPRKDQCGVCVSYECVNLSERDWTAHRKNKDLARNQKSKDKIDAHEGKCHLLAMDLQAVKLSPMLKASSLYYKTKLMVHNFTIYNLGTKDAKFYWWDETEGDLASSTFATCLMDYITNNFKDNLPVIIYSDGCTSQNRNAMMSNMLLELAINQKRTIIQKFLEKGHTQMECDSIHSAIESELLNKKIYIPCDYLKISLDARAAMPHKARLLNHGFFKDMTMKKHQRYTSIRPGESKGDPCVTDLRLIYYSPEGIIRYTLNYEEAEWTELPQKPKVVKKVVYPPLYENRLKIKPRKFKDLQDLKPVLPKMYHRFYDNIPYD